MRLARTAALLDAETRKIETKPLEVGKTVDDGPYVERRARVGEVSYRGEGVFGSVIVDGCSKNG